jgi:6-pyruvoyltetrahydropterin/6-carboxytetrahydropterin synthase
MLSTKFRLQVKTHFDAAHYIRNYVGKCSREHGHRWEVEVVLESTVLDERNMLVDFKSVKSLLNDLVDAKLDHWQLNETLREPNVTAEYLSKWIYVELEGLFHAVSTTPPLNYEIRDAVQRGLKLVRVTVWESPDCCVKYYQEGGEDETDGR